MRTLITKDSEHGTISYGWVEGKESTFYRKYLPKNSASEKMLELSYIEGSKSGAGHYLLQQFLASPEAQNADVIVLEATPLVSGRKHPHLTDAEYVDFLVGIYSAYGFVVGKRYSRGSAMMYKLQIKNETVPAND